MTDDLIAWHYTVDQHARSILKQGVIRPATAGVPPGEMPVVWFSVNQRWENTANKSMGTHDGRVVHLDGPGTWRHFGAWRFGLLATELLPYRDLVKAAHISRATRRALEHAAKRMKADPSQWHGSLEPISIYSQRIVQVMDIATREWRDPLSS